MTTDVIVSWPRYADYPLWRRWIADERGRFGRVLVAFTDHDGPDLSGWVRANLRADVEFIDTPPGDADWRDRAVNACLDRSDAPWVWFTEQDFIPRGRFWTLVDNVYGADLIGWREPVSNRWHPSCLFVRREAIEERYFGPDPVDHFTAFGRQFEGRPTVALPADVFEHLQGTSQNQWLLLWQGTEDGVFRGDRFREWLRDGLAAGVPLNPDWERAARRALEGS